jgi:hypothetical protein
LDGSITEAQKRLEAADKWITAGNITLIAFISIAVSIAVLAVVGGHPVLSTIAMINVLLGALIGFPFVFVGSAKLIKAKRLISPSQASEDLAVQDSTPKELPAPDTAELGPPKPRGSITEQTTIHLKEPDSSVPH